LGDTDSPRRDIFLRSLAAVASVSSFTLPLIILDAVTAVRASGVVAVRDLTWSVSEGETWAIVGPTGSGKSTLADVLLGRHCITAGTIAWPMLARLGFGWAADAIRLVSFRERSHLFSPARHYYQQRFNFVEPHDDLTLEHFLRSGDDSDITLVASQLGLTELLPLSFIALSTGEMRRARIARALLSRPELLILDDPFVGLDAAGRGDVTDLLGGLVRSGTRLILITRPEDAPEWITNVLTLENGGLVDRAEQVRLAVRDSASHGGPLSLRSFNSPAFGVTEPIIELRNVSVAYGPRVALREVSWTVRAGERWAVVGPNGSGKTTLLSLLCGDHPQAYANEVRLFGRRRGSGDSIWDVKRSVGLVSSELHLYYAEPLSTTETAATGFYDVLAYRRPTPAQAAAVRHLLSQFGILDLANRRFDQLSTGEQRLVLLVRALVKKPPLLILDEPFQGMDRPTMERARDWLDQHLLPNQTLIVVTHDPVEIPRSVTRRLELDRGRVIS
jgi:molybdate transport system ATP-binding protein